MKLLKDQGFKTLYFEHLFYDNQKDLDQFNKTGILSDTLKMQLETSDQGHMKGKETEGFTYTQILLAAHEAGIRVVAIDAAATYCTQSSKAIANPDDNTRERYFSYTACSIIEEDVKKNPMKKGDKYIALMGAAHVATHNNVPGVGELLGVRSVVIGDTDKKPSVSIPGNESTYNLTADVLMHLDPKQKADVVMQLDPKQAASVVVADKPVIEKANTHAVQSGFTAISEVNSASRDQVQNLRNRLNSGFDDDFQTPPPTPSSPPTH